MSFSHPDDGSLCSVGSMECWAQVCVSACKDSQMNVEGEMGESMTQVRSSAFRSGMELTTVADSRLSSISSEKIPGQRYGS